MPKDATCACRECLGLFRPRALRTSPDEQRLVIELSERILKAHPAWPWPLIEKEVRRQAAEVATMLQQHDHRSGGRGLVERDGQDAAHIVVEQRQLLAPVHHAVSVVDVQHHAA